MNIYHKYEFIRKKIEEKDKTFLYKIEKKYNEISHGFYHLVTKNDKEAMERNRDLADKLFYSRKNFKDKRDTYTFLLDIFIGWLVEDYVYICMKDFFSGYDVYIDYYSTQSRTIINETPPEADFIVKYGNRNIVLELISNWPIRQDNCTFWDINSFFDLRYNKYNKLLNKTKQYEVYIILYKPYHNQYQMLNVKNIDKIERMVKAYEFGNKIGTRIFINNKNFQEFNKCNFINFIDFGYKVEYAKEDTAK